MVRIFKLMYKTLNNMVLHKDAITSQLSIFVLFRFYKVEKQVKRCPSLEPEMSGQDGYKQTDGCTVTDFTLIGSSESGKTWEMQQEFVPGTVLGAVQIPHILCHLIISHPKQKSAPIYRCTNTDSKVK